MIKKHSIERVISNDLIAQNTYLMKLSCTDDCLRLFRPGQFAHIEIPHAKELLLRRPISINYVDYEKHEVHLAYNAIGKGTRLLSLVHAGDTLDVMMPMGNGFGITENMKRIWLIGGGIGVAPLKSLYSKYPDREYTAFLGFRNKEMVFQNHDFEMFAKTHITTDDGSFCEHGFCTDVLHTELANVGEPDVILACGPLVFFKSLAKVVGDIPTLVSMEQHMGCGTGGCAVCVCKINGEHKKVCTQGPVFNIREVDSLYE
ncbi:MAG: dihydroorotate dehydrogenase electron transfer subunit [Christensenella sp.]